MILLFILGFVFCVCVAAVGGVMLWRGISGEAVIEIKGWKVEGPIGFILIVFALGGAVWTVTQFAPTIEAENKRLEAESTTFKNNLKSTASERDSLQGQLRDEKNRADGLALEVKAQATEKEQVERNLVAAQSDLTQARGDVANTRKLLGDETERANGLTRRNEDLLKQITDEQLQRRGAQEKTFAVLELASRFGLSDRQKAEFDDVKKGVLDLNKDLTLLAISVSPLPTLEGQRAVATFEIYQKAFELDRSRPRGAGIFDFTSEQYKVKGDPQGRIAVELRNSIASAICKAATRAIIENVPLPNAVRDMPPISGYDVDRDFLGLLAEMQYIYLQMRLKLMAGKASILVRGYADGERTSWEQKLDPSRDSIQIHAMVDPSSSEYDLRFRSQLTRMLVGRPATNRTTYGNVDLPNLRAQEAHDIIEPLVDSCSTPNTSVDLKVEILQGHVYSEHGPVDRKVRAHLLVFLKEP